MFSTTCYPIVTPSHLTYGRVHTVQHQKSREPIVQNIVTCPLYRSRHTLRFRAGGRVLVLATRRGQRFRVALPVSLSLFIFKYLLNSTDFMFPRKRASAVLESRRSMHSVNFAFVIQTTGLAHGTGSSNGSAGSWAPLYNTHCGSSTIAYRTAPTLTRPALSVLKSERFEPTRQSPQDWREPAWFVSSGCRKQETGDEQPY